jgi:tetratricopeptide (TPR) repeat protein
MNRTILLLAIVALSACSPKRVRERPILHQGDRVGNMDATVAGVRSRAAEEQARTGDQVNATRAEALANCQGEICGALARGEVVLGMTEAQVLAATSTTADAWSVRRAGQAAVLAPATQGLAPRDQVGELALVQLRNGRVASYSYQEAQGVRVVQRARDATAAGRADALAEMLIREGDDLAARGDLDGALNRYDRADVLRAGDAELDYRIATVLDKQLRPIEALIRYQLFLHRLEIEKIEARGDAYAKLADAIAQARERIIVLEKRGG